MARLAQIKGDPAARTQNLVGLGAIAAELAHEGVALDKLFARTDMAPAHLEDTKARISHQQRLAIYRNAMRLAERSDIGLAAGARQKISDYGIYGYAMLSSRTFNDALAFSLDHLAMAGPSVREISFRIENDTAILRSHDCDRLGELLPFAAEFWRSSMTTLFSRVLEAPFPTRLMTFPFAAPAHWRAYRRMFACEVAFDAPCLEWHFDTAVLERACPNANSVTAEICRQLCSAIMAEAPGEPELLGRIRSACLGSREKFPSAAAMAADLGLSLRTFHRRLAEGGTSYQAILDGIRRTLAIDLLENTDLALGDIAERIGFADVVGFRKAFKNWTGRSTKDYRSGAMRM